MMQNLKLRQWIARTIELGGLYGTLQSHYGRKGGGFILAYHNPPPELFVAQMEALHPNRPIPLDELIDRAIGNKPTAGLFAVTLDDGVGDTVRAFSNICIKNAWPITYYIPTNYIQQKVMPFQRLAILQRSLPPDEYQTSRGTVNLRDVRSRARYFSRITEIMYTSREESYVPVIDELWQLAADTRENKSQPPLPITWKEMEQLSKNPLICFESHGVSHQAISALPDDQVERELQDSRNCIQEHTGREVRHFCYPFGSMASIGQRAPRLAAKYFKSAVTLLRGRVAGQNPHLLPRIPLYDHDTPSITRLKILTA